MRKPRVYLSIPMAVPDSVRDALIRRYPEIEFSWWDKSKPYSINLLNNIDAIAFISIGNKFSMKVSQMTTGCQSEYREALDRGLQILGVYETMANGKNLYATSPTLSDLVLIAGTTNDVIQGLKVKCKMEDSSGSMKQLDRSDWYIKAACQDEAEVLAVYTNTFIRNDLFNEKNAPKEWTPDDSMTYYLRIKNGRYEDGDSNENNLIGKSRRISFVEFLTTILPSFEKQFPYAIAKHHGWNEFLAQYDLHPTEPLPVKVDPCNGFPIRQQELQITDDFCDARLLLML